MSGFRNEAALKLHDASDSVHPAYLPGILYDLGSYPAAVYTPNHKKNIIGEIVRIKSHMLSDVLDMLDQFEGIDPVTLEGSQYIRTLIPVEVDSAAEQAWCYLYNGNSNGLKVIASGNYLDR